MISARLLAFCEALRKNGVRAAEGEVLDAFRALALVPVALAERSALLALLSATLAKSPSEEEILERVFALHFDPLVVDDAAAAPPLDELLRERGVAPERVEALLRALELDAAADAILRALLSGDGERLGELVRAMLEESDMDGLQSSLQIAYFTSRVLARLGHGGIEERFLRARAALRPGGAGDARPAGEEEDALVASALWQLTERLRRAARRAVERELEKRTVASPARGGGRRSLLDRDLRAVDAAEIDELRALVRRLALKLKTRLLARRRRRRRGRVDARRTLRKSVATDAVPMQVEFHRRRPARPELVILCDVSDSVRQASLFMLELVGALSDVLPRARSFVFVDRVVEVTDLFREGAPGAAPAAAAARINTAVAAILSGDVIAVSNNSDYGRALRGFFDRHATALINRRTTVVVLGDGRSNYRPPEDWVLAEVRRRARRLLWLSPEDRGTWGYGDSEMPRFARHADAIFVVRTAADLAKAIDRVTR